MKTCRPACPLIKGLLLTLCILFLFNSCQKEDLFGLDPAVQPQASLLGESQVFLKNLTEKRPLQATPKLSRHRAVKIPLWDKAQKVQLSIGEGLKVPLAYREEIKLLIGPNKEEAPLSDWTYLLLYKDRQQKWHAEVVTRIPDEQYWINRNRPGRSFSGIILVEDWWGRPIKTFQKFSTGKYKVLANPIPSTKYAWKSKDEIKNLNAPNEDCIVIVHENELGMYDVEFICDGPENDGTGGKDDSGGSGGGGLGGGFGGGFGGGGWGDGGLGGHGGAGGSGPNHGDYEEPPRGGGGGRRNDNPPQPDEITEPEFLDMEVIDTVNLHNYPKFKSIIKNIPAFLNKYPNVKKALAYYTGFSEAKIAALMQPGKGPKVQVVANLTDNYGQPAYGFYNNVTKTLQINENWVRSLDAAQSERSTQTTGLLLLITTFHEFVHYGRDQNRLTTKIVDPITNETYEAGLTFEANIVPNGQAIDHNNAIKWIKYYPFHF